MVRGKNIKFLNSENSSRVLVFTLAVGGYQYLFHDCLKSHLDYARRYDYDYIAVTKLPWSITAHDAAWLKVPLMIAAIQLDYEWVIFLDSDCHIRDFSPPIETVIREGKHLYMAKGISGRLNSGVILAKGQDKEVESVLQQILDNADAHIQPENRAPYENGHFIQYINPSSNFFEFLDNEKWNNNTALNPKSYIQHYSGKTLRDYYKENYISRYDFLRSRAYKYFKKAITFIRPSRKKKNFFFLKEKSTSKRLEMLISEYGDTFQYLLS